MAGTSALQNDGAAWLQLASSRLQPATPDSSPTSALVREPDPATGRVTITLECLPSSSYGAVSHVLLQQLIESSSDFAQLRGVQIALPPASSAPAPEGEAPAASSKALCPAEEQQQEQEQQRGAGPLRLQFRATEPAAEGRAEQAAQLFEASGRTGSSTGLGDGSFCWCLQVATLQNLFGTTPTFKTPPLCRTHMHVSHPNTPQPIPRCVRACLVQAYWQYHSKAAKSHLHCRMRQRLAALRQQLMLAKFDAL